LKASSGTETALSQRYRPSQTWSTLESEKEGLRLEVLTLVARLTNGTPGLDRLTTVMDTCDYKDQCPVRVMLKAMFPELAL
jgi:hypothetical protein